LLPSGPDGARSGDSGMAVKSPGAGGRGSDGVGGDAALAAKGEELDGTGASGFAGSGAACAGGSGAGGFGGSGSSQVLASLAQGPRELPVLAQVVSRVMELPASVAARHPTSPVPLLQVLELRSSVMRRARISQVLVRAPVGAALVLQTPEQPALVALPSPSNCKFRAPASS
jgi:hypothetical protein